MDIVQTLDITQQGENNLYNWDYSGSPYAANTPGVSTTLLLGPSVDPRLVRSYNQSYSNTLFFLGLPKVQCDGATDTWYEEPNIESPVTVRAPGVAAVPNATTGSVPQTIPIDDASYSTVGLGQKLIYPDAETEGYVIAKAGTAGSYTIDVRSLEGKAFPALAAGDSLGNSGERHGDGQALAQNTYRSAVVEFTNNHEEMGPFANRWDPKDSQRWINSQNVEYKQMEVRRLQDRYFNAILKTILVSSGGRVQLNNGRFSLATKGAMNQMIDNAVAVSTLTAADMMDWIRQTVHDNQIQDGEEDWLLIGPGRILDKIGAAEISQRLRYQVGDHTYDTTLTKYRYWGHTVTPIRLNSMENMALYGTGLANRVILIRKSQLKLTGMKGWPMFGMMTKNRLANNQNVDPITGFANIEYMEYRAHFGIRVEAAWSGGLADVLS